MIDRRRVTCRARAAGIVVVMLLGCTAHRPASRPEASTTPDGRPAMSPPTTRTGLLGPLTPDMTPSAQPVQAGETIRSQALPTNQWWTSALAGPWTQPLWAFPVAARAAPAGFELSAPVPTVTADAVVSGFSPALTVGGPLRSTAVAGYGDFSVTLDLSADDGRRYRATVAQGSPTVDVAVDAGRVPVDLVAGAQVSDDSGAPLVAGQARTTSHVRVVSGGQSWDLLIGAETTWERAGDRLVADVSSPTSLVLAPRPEGPDGRWDALLAQTARRPLTTTRSDVRLDHARGVAHQVLTWERGGTGSGPGLVALLEHQRLAASPAPPPVAGRYRTSRGDLTLAATDSLALDVPVPALLAGVPDVGLTAEERAAVASDVDADAGATSLDGGSASGSRALGRLATLVDVARRVSTPAAAGRLADQLRAGVDDWLTYTGAGDQRWLAYDPAWGGIVAHPAELGNQSYDNHHVQYGYLIQAAATVAADDPAFAARVGPIVDLLVDDVLGSANPAFPPFRVFNAYEGHSYASGFAVAPDGNDEESSSEAVHGWEAVVRWGLVRRHPATVDAALTRYAVEALAARTYWLGEDSRPYPAGYQHDGAGIVWGGKTDFATFSDRRPDAVIATQLLPFTFGSLYRSDPAAARRRAEAVGADGRAPTRWPDLFLLDRALFDPIGAEADLGDGVAVEAGNSRAFTRDWLETFRHLGTVRRDVWVDPPFGLAFTGPAGDRFVLLNPTGAAVTVTFRDGRRVVIGAARLGARQSRTVDRLR